MQTTGNEFFYTVSGLRVPHFEVSDSLVDDMIQFTEWVPEHADQFEDYFNTSLGLFINEMGVLEQMLRAIYAVWLVNDAGRIFKLVSMNEHNLCSRLIAPFVSKLHTLALDIMVAQSNMSHDGRFNRTDEIEHIKDMKINLRIVSKLIRNDEYEKALDIINKVNEMDVTAHLTPIMLQISNKNKAVAGQMINDIINGLNQRITNALDTTIRVTKEKKILLVDDMPETLTTLCHMLKDHYKVYAFNDAVQALKFIDYKQEPDVFMLDVDMPAMDGFTLAKNIRLRSKYRHTSLVFLTSNSERVTLMKAHLYNPKAFIVKPPDKEVILTRLNQCFN